MRAAIYERYGDPSVLAVRDLPVPRPATGELLIRVRAAALNPKDVLMRKGRFRLLSGRRFPQRCGYDFAGEVAALGGNATGFSVGDRVWGARNGVRAGSCAEFVTAPAASCGRMPAGLDFHGAAALPLVAQTALQALRDRAAVEPGQSALLHGAAGGVGSHAIQIARALSLHVTTTSSAANLARCRELGAAVALDYARDDPFAERRYDVVFDIFGNRSFAWARPGLAARGTYVTTVPSLAILRDGLRTALTRPRARLVIIRSRTRDLDWLGGLVAGGELRAIIDRVYSLDEIAAAHAYLETRRARGKVVIDV